MLPIMVEDLSRTRAATSLLASTNFLGYLAGALLAAMLTVPGWWAVSPRFPRSASWPV